MDFDVGPGNVETRIGGSFFLLFYSIYSFSLCPGVCGWLFVMRNYACKGSVCHVSPLVHSLDANLGIVSINFGLFVLRFHSCVLCVYEMYKLYISMFLLIYIDIEHE